MMFSKKDVNFSNWDRITSRMYSSKSTAIIDDFFHSVAAHLLLMLFSKSSSLFAKVPLLKKLPLRVSLFFKVCGTLLFYKLLFSSGYLLMDELGRAVAQFDPTSAGMYSYGGSSMPPGPSGHTSWFLASADGTRPREEEAESLYSLSTIEKLPSRGMKWNSPAQTCGHNEKN